MGIKDKLFSLIDNIGLADKFAEKPYDAEGARKPLLKGIGNTKRQFLEGQTKAPNRWWKAANGVVALTVKVGGNTLDINGQTTNHIPEERFVGFLDQFKQAVEAGEFDEELKGHGKGDAKVPTARRARGAAADPGPKPAGDWELNMAGTKWITPAMAERGRKVAASRAANKAKK